MKTERLVGYAFAFGAALAYGTNSVLIRHGVVTYGAPLSGLSIAILVGLLSVAPLSFRAYRHMHGPFPLSAVGLLLLSGITFSIGLGANYLALSLLPVTVATPITSGYPLISVLLARLFLQTSERVTRQVVLGSLCVAAGTALVALGRPV